MTSRILATLLLTLSICFPAQTSFAQSPSAKRLEKIEASWLQWARQNRIDATQLAVSYRGNSVLLRARNVETTAPMKLASLSKAITGVCILALEKNKKLSRDTTIGDIRSNRARTSFPDNDSKEITISQLLTHTSGLKPDYTQGRMGNWLGRSQRHTKDITRKALDYRNLDGKVGDFFYNNGNYAALGTIIKTVMKEDYDKACKEALKKVDGIKKLKLGLRMNAFSSFGGWVGSAKDFLAFANASFGRKTKFQEKPFDLPWTEIEKDLYYGPGVYFRENRRSGYNIWHFGQVCFPDPIEDGGSYFAVYGKEWSVAVTHNACLKTKAMFGLDAAMVRGVFGRF